MREAKARLKMSLNSLSRPPIPRSSNLKSGRMTELAAGRRVEPLRLIGDFAFL